MKFSNVNKSSTSSSNDENNYDPGSANNAQSTSDQTGLLASNQQPTMHSEEVSSGTSNNILQIEDERWSMLIENESPLRPGAIVANAPVVPNGASQPSNEALWNEVNNRCMNDRLAGNNINATQPLDAMLGPGGNVICSGTVMFALGRTQLGVQDTQPHTMPMPVNTYNRHPVTIAEANSLVNEDATMGDNDDDVVENHPDPIGQNVILREGTNSGVQVTDNCIQDGNHRAILVDDQRERGLSNVRDEAGLLHQDSAVIHHLVVNSGEGPLETDQTFLLRETVNNNDQTNVAGISNDIPAAAAAAATATSESPPRTTSFTETTGQARDEDPTQGVPTDVINQTPEQSALVSNARTELPGNRASPKRNVRRVDEEQASEKNKSTQ